MNVPTAPLACVLAVALAPAAWAADGPALVPLTGPVPGAPAPPFSVKTLAGKTVSLETYRGRTLVITAWATSCPPCRQEMPDLVAAAPKLAKDGVAFLGVDTTDDSTNVRAYVAVNAVPLAQAVDAGGSFAQAYDVHSFPTTFVIDPQGILRARYTDALAAAPLARLVAGAKRGLNGRVDSPLQAKIDATLSDPAIGFEGDPAVIEAGVKRAQSAIAAVDEMLGASDAANGNGTDLLQTRAEESALRDKAIAALVSVGTSPPDEGLLPLFRGDAARDREQWKDALDAYRAALGVDPKNSRALAGLALAGERLERYDVAVDAYRQLAELNSTDAETLVALARAQTAAGRKDDASATFSRADALATRLAEAHPSAPAFLRMPAFVHLWAGRAYAANADPERARAEFEQVIAWARRLPSNDASRDTYFEEAQEAEVALGLAAPHSGAAASLVPWTGPDLPGSIPNTRPFRLAVVAAAGANVAVTTAGVPSGWVASFCTDRVCSPGKVTLAIPDAGVKIVEFQLVPPTQHARTPKVRVTVRAGASQSSVTT